MQWRKKQDNTRILYTMFGKKNYKIFKKALHKDKLDWKKICTDISITNTQKYQSKNKGIEYQQIYRVIQPL